MGETKHKMTFPCSSFPALGVVGVSIAAGPEHACLAVTNGTVLCWGGNDNGQLGTGDTIDAVVPNKTLELMAGIVSCTSAYWNHFL